MTFEQFLPKIWDVCFTNPKFKIVLNRRSRQDICFDWRGDANRGTTKIQITPDRTESFWSNDCGLNAGGQTQSELARNLFIICEKADEGASGGSCWGDEARYWSRDGLTKDLFVWDILKPLLDALEVKDTDFVCDKLMDSEVIKFNTRQETEWYGNWTSFSGFYFTLGDLHDFLVANSSPQK